jgi:hypothetical protein
MGVPDLPRFSRCPRPASKSRECESAAAWGGATSPCAVPRRHGVSATSGGVRPSVERRRAVALARHSEKPKRCPSTRSPSVSAARRRRSRPTSMTPPARKRVRSRGVMSGSAGAAGHTRSRATAKGTRTRTARPAIPARSSAAGPGSGCSRRWGSGSIVTAGCRHRMTGREPMHDGEGERRCAVSRRANGRRRAWSARCSGTGRRRGLPPGRGDGPRTGEPVRHAGPDGGGRSPAGSPEDEAFPASSADQDKVLGGYAVAGRPVGV